MLGDALAGLVAGALVVGVVTLVRQALPRKPVTDARQG
jgi:hypothetical protein